MAPLSLPSDLGEQGQQALVLVVSEEVARIDLAFQQPDHLKIRHAAQYTGKVVTCTHVDGCESARAMVDRRPNGHFNTHLVYQHDVIALDHGHDCRNAANPYPV